MGRYYSRTGPLVARASSLHAVRLTRPRLHVETEGPDRLHRRRRYLPWLVDLLLVALILVNLWYATDLPSDPYVPVPREAVRYDGDRPQIHVNLPNE